MKGQHRAGHRLRERSGPGLPAGLYDHLLSQDPMAAGEVSRELGSPQGHMAMKTNHLSTPLGSFGSPFKAFHLASEWLA